MFLDKKKTTPWIRAGALIIAILFAALYIVPLIDINSGGPPDQNQATSQQELKYAQDVQKIESLLSTNPTDTAARVSLGNTYFDWALYLALEKKEATEAVKKFEQAAINYQKALESDPDNANVRTDMAVALFYTGKGDQALAELKKVMEKHPDHEPAFFNYAFMLEKMGKTQEAIKAWQDFLQRFPNSQNADAARARLSSLTSGQPGQ